VLSGLSVFSVDNAVGQVYPVFRSLHERIRDSASMQPSQVCLSDKQNRCQRDVRVFSANAEEKQMSDLLPRLKELASLQNGGIRVDTDAVCRVIDDLIFEAVLHEDAETRIALQRFIIEAGKQMGIVPSSIQGLYEEFGRNYPGCTVPAINIRGLTYDVCRAVFRKMADMSVGPVIFEIARSEIGYTKQRPLEYTAAVVAAAIKECYRGPVFLQGDHFQCVLKYYSTGPDKEKEYVKSLIAEAIDAEFYNIDVDTSTLVDLSLASVKEQQGPNYRVAAEMTDHIRSVEPEGVTVSVGGEIGEIGKENSNPDELRAFLEGYRETFTGAKGLSKLSVQTGTSHGGVVLADGTLADVKIDFDTLQTLSDLARKEFGLSGAVQHGASTLPSDAFHMFPETGTAEVHLATGFQNIIYDSTHLPEEFRKEIYDYIHSEFGSEKKDGETDEQFLYKTRKKGFGGPKKKWWNLPGFVKDPIMKELEAQFDLLFRELRVTETRQLLDHVKLVPVKNYF